MATKEENQKAREQVAKCKEHILTIHSIHGDRAVCYCGNCGGSWQMQLFAVRMDDDVVFPNDI